MADETVPVIDHNPTVPGQPQAAAPMKTSRPLVIGACAVVGIIGIANVGNLATGHAKNQPVKSNLTGKPVVSDSGQVNSFQAAQARQAQHDQAELLRQQEIAAQAAILQQQQETPGPESATAPAMTPAQRQAMYGSNNPNAPQKTSGVSEAQAQAKQKALLREQQHQQALASDTVAIDFSSSAVQGSTTSKPGGVLSDSAEGQDVARGESEGSPAAPSTGPDEAGGADNVRLSRNAAQGAAGSVQNALDGRATTQRDPMAAYDFDGFQGRLYRVFEGTVFEGVVTNHIDGALAGPMIVMLTTDYYSHDHQQLLFPQGTRLIGNVQSVGASGQRKLMVTFNRAICPDGFSLDLNRFTGLDPLGTTGLETSVNNHYLSSFVAAAAVGGIGGLAQVGNSGSVLDSGTQIRNGISSQTAAESEQVLNKFLSRLPVITVKEGSRARVYINQDFLVPSYAEHRVDPTL
jgi:type IV secretory pathway VirB10-like protein